MTTALEEDPSLAFPSALRHSLTQLSRIEYTLSHRKDWSFRDTLDMAHVLVSHAHPAARAFLSWIQTTLDHPDVHKKIQRMLTMCDLAEGQAHLHALRQNAPLMAQLYATQGHCFVKGDTHPQTLVVVFTTIYNNFGISNLWLYALLKDTGVSILMLKDNSRASYLAGVRGAGGNLDDTAAFVEAFATHHHCEHILVMGYSSGGFASYYVSTQLTCRAYLGLSIVTDFSLTTPLPTEKFIGRAIREKFNPKFLIDLSKISLPTHTKTPRRLLVGADSATDQLFTNTMTGVPNLEVIQVADCQHDTPEGLMVLGDFTNQVNWLLAHAR